MPLSTRKIEYNILKAMPFIETNIEKEIEMKRECNPEFRKEWDDSRAAYELIGQMISLREKDPERISETDRE